MDISKKSFIKSKRNLFILVACLIGILIIGSSTLIVILSAVLLSETHLVHQQAISYPVSNLNNKNDADTFIYNMNDTSKIDLQNYTIYNIDGSSLSLEYPVNWQVFVDSNNTWASDYFNYSFISPTDSTALFYDYALSKGIYKCDNSKLTLINNSNQKFARSYDDKWNNWYICDYDVVNKFYYVDKYDYFSANAINNKDLKSIDQILQSVVRNKNTTSVVMSKVFNFSLEYDPKLGQTTDETTKMMADNSVFCTIEQVKFSNTPVDIVVLKGMKDGCYPAWGGENIYENSIMSRDNNYFNLSVDVNDNDKNEKQLSRSYIQATYNAGDEDTSNPYLNGETYIEVGTYGYYTPQKIERYKTQINDLVKNLTFQTGYIGDKFDKVKL